jgi:hypothetical protein
MSGRLRTKREYPLLEGLVRLIARERSVHQLLRRLVEEKKYLRLCQQIYAQVGDPQFEAELTRTGRPYGLDAESIRHRITPILQALHLVEDSEGPWSVLGLVPGADSSEIKKAYRRLSLRYHPDHNRDDPRAEEHFLKIRLAYELLSRQTSIKGAEPSLSWLEDLPSGEAGRKRGVSRSFLWQIGLAVTILLMATVVLDWFYPALVFKEHTVPSHIQEPLPIDVPSSVARLPEKPVQSRTTSRGEPTEATQGGQEKVENRSESALLAQSTTSHPIETALKHEVMAARPMNEDQSRLSVQRDRHEKKAESRKVPIAPLQLAKAAPAEKPVPVIKQDFSMPKAETKIASREGPLQPESRPVISTSSDEETAHAEHTLSKKTQSQESAATKPAPSQIQVLSLKQVRPAPTPKPKACTLPVKSKTIPLGSSDIPDHSKAAKDVLSVRTTEQLKAALAEVTPGREMSTTDLQSQLDAFLASYSLAYCSKNVVAFGEFFTPDAHENGVPIRELFPKYAQDFKHVTIRQYQIRLQSWQHTGESIQLEGSFVLSLLWTDGRVGLYHGTISMRVRSNLSSFQVERLDYRYQ